MYIEHGVVPQQVGVERSTSATLRLKLIYRLIPADRSTNKLIRRLIDQTTNTMTNIFAPQRDSNTLYSRQCQYMRRAPPALHPRLFHLYHTNISNSADSWVVINHFIDA